MKIFLDTANLEQIRLGFKSGLIDGITTNPSLAAKEGVEFNSLIKEILKLFKGTDKILNLEVINTNSRRMIEEGRQLAKISKNVAVKMPMTLEGMIACKELSKRKIRVNVTLCFSANQALLAAKAGAFFISPFVGRLDDKGQNGMDLIHEIRQIYDNYNFKTKILVASVRNPEHVKEAALIGADVATIPYKVYEELFKHPLTDSGLKTFLDDWNKLQKKLKHGRSKH